MAKTKTAPERWMNVRQASAYLGVAQNTLRKMTRLGLAPAPLDLPGMGRIIYDRIEIDAAMEARAQRAAQ